MCDFFFSLSYFRGGRSIFRKQKLLLAFRAIETVWHVIMEISSKAHGKTDPALSSVLYHEIALGSVTTRPFWHNMKAMVQKGAFHDFFKLSIFRQEQQRSVSVYDRQVGILLKLSTFEKYVYLNNQPINVLQICPNLLQRTLTEQQLYTLFRLRKFEKASL